MKILISLSSQSKDEAPDDIVLEVRFPARARDGARAVVGLLRNLQAMGNWGCSRGIKIEDWDPADYFRDRPVPDWFRNSFGFDGDGADTIKDIRVNGQSLKDEQ